MREHPDCPYEIEVLVGIWERRSLSALHDLGPRGEVALEPRDAGRVELGAVQLGRIGNVQELPEHAARAAPKIQDALCRRNVEPSAAQDLEHPPGMFLSGVEVRLGSRAISFP